MSSPAAEFFVDANQNVLAARTEITAGIARNSPVLVYGVNSLVEKYLARASRPPLGELIPWMVADLFLIRRDSITDIAAAWLRVYLFISFLDDLLDNEASLHPDEALAATVLFRDGSATMSTLVWRTPYEHVLRNSFYTAAEGELLDLRQKSALGPDKTDSARRKNGALVSFAATLASRHPEIADSIIGFSEAILLAFQYLDDLCDLYDDYKAGNYTSVLSRIGQEPNFACSGLSKVALLRLVIVSGALGSALDEIAHLLQGAVCLLTPSLYANATSGADYLRSLIDNVVVAAAEVGTARELLTQECSNEDKILVKVDRAIDMVAQSS